ncbi:MAG: hypothetical protein L6R41_004288, partial [Letrouitia leprolyta]
CIRVAVFAKAIGVKVPTIKSFAQLSRIQLRGSNDLETDEMINADWGISGLSAEQIKAKYGYPGGDVPPEEMRG